MVSMLLEDDVGLVCDDGLADDEPSVDAGPLGGRTLLGFAAARGDTEVVKALLPEVDVDRRDREVRAQTNPSTGGAVMSPGR